MKKKLAIIVLFIIGLFMCLPFVHAQDLSGYWEGTCMKKGGDTPFFMSMSLEQKGNEVSGTALIKYEYTGLETAKESEGWYCVKKVRGVVVGGYLKFTDTGFVAHHHDFGAYWLLLKGKLRYTSHGDGDELKGEVDAYDPVYGSMYSKHDFVKLKKKETKYVAIKNSLFLNSPDK